MSSATGRGRGDRTIRHLFSRIRHRFHKPAHSHLDPETLRRLNAPAKLFTWQANGGTEESQTYDTLREAIAQVPENPEDRTFIITESGHIIRPSQIAKLKQLIENT